MFKLKNLSLSFEFFIKIFDGFPCRRMRMGSLVGIIFCMNSFFVQSEDILVKNKKPKTESVSKLKEQIAIDLEELLSSGTHSIRLLTNLIDDIVHDVQQLAGQESGPLTCADKKTLETFSQQVRQVKKAVQELESACSLKV